LLVGEFVIAFVIADALGLVVRLQIAEFSKMVVGDN
jgi:hypothetical protein